MINPILSDKNKNASPYVIFQYIVLECLQEIQTSYCLPSIILKVLKERNTQFIVLAGKASEQLLQISNKLLLSGFIFPPTVSCNVEGMKKDTDRKEQHIKTASQASR